MERRALSQERRACSQKKVIEAEKGGHEGRKGGHRSKKRRPWMHEKEAKEVVGKGGHGEVEGSFVMLSI